MRNSNLRPFLSALCLLAVFAGFSRVSAGPIRFDQVVQVVNAHPAKGESFNFARLRVASPYSGIVIGIDDGDDDKKKKDQKPTQDTRVITETRTDIVEDEVCDCDQIEPDKERKFPKWALLGLAAIPVAFILIKNKKDTPTPTPTTPTTPTPPITPTPTPTATPTVTPTPPITPTPTPPEPVPEPITILLFGTGLAGVGLAARRRLRKGSSADSDESDQ